MDIRITTGRGFTPITSLLLAFALTSASAETVKLKDGSVLTGQIISNTSESIILRTKETELKIEQSLIQSIDYADRGKATVVLNDGSRLTGTIEEQDAESLALNTTLGIFTVKKSDIKSIEYPRAEVPAQPQQPPQPAAPDPDRVRAGLRAVYFQPLGRTMSDYGLGTGGAVFMEARFGRAAAGLDYTAATFGSDASAKKLNVSANQLTVAYSFHFLGGPFSVSPRLGIGNAFLRSTEKRAEYSALSNYYLQNGDTTGLLISMLDSTGNVDKLLPAYYFLSRGDTVGYLISDQRNFTRQRSGNAPLVSIGVGSAYTFKSGLSLGVQLSLAHIADRSSNLHFGSVAVEGSWKF